MGELIWKEFQKFITANFYGKSAIGRLIIEWKELHQCTGGQLPNLFLAPWVDRSSHIQARTQDMIIDVTVTFPYHLGPYIDDRRYTVLKEDIEAVVNDFLLKPYSKFQQKYGYPKFSPHFDWTNTPSTDTTRPFDFMVEVPNWGTYEFTMSHTEPRHNFIVKTHMGWVVHRIIGDQFVDASSFDLLPALPTPGVDLEQVPISNLEVVYVM
ncbi:hypothetical protein BDP27DRAFT_1404913 [Rhodocollybia butyracea]|uniref:Uncharacterized protein n=1 Tax=Rhodocollybia butyracea TaxID=206335 RepID=A0A9P5PL81_9AGAR|nr:hypothetical protein BDP27DRAFT_1404913 [Rhodocollybia butyracea]